MPSSGKTRKPGALYLLIVLIVFAIAGILIIRNWRSQPASVKPRRAPLVDEQPVQTARKMAQLASTREEQRLAQQALRLADHAIDLAFSGAMREATLHPAPVTPETKELFDHVTRAQAQVKSDQELIDTFTKEAAATKNPASDLQQQIALLQAQLELDKDELEDARNDLLRSGADPLSRIQRQFARYKAAQQQADNNRTQVAPDSSATPPATNLVAQFRVWREQRSKALQLQAARDEALAKRDQLRQKHDTNEQAEASDSTEQSSQESAAQPPAQTKDQAVLALLHRLAERQKNLSDLDSRIQDHQDLADVYANWAALVGWQQKAAARAMIQSALLILLLILLVHLADLAVDRLFGELISDQRRLRTLRVILHFVVEASGILLGLLIIFGMPNQLSTILGLAGAGLTVALKDFIVAFFGWFALMGRNGMRVGDWVEIEGVVGEVAEIGLLRTVLLETGNWNAAGHPTGRKVAFVNSFAIEGHFFNFSTSGQWLWDEIQVLLPADQNPYPTLESIQHLVTKATTSNAHLAEEEWRRATRREHVSSVSAAPAIDLRPTNAGVEVRVRYITRAYERSATRTQLYQEIVALLHQREPDPSGAPAK